MLSVVPTAEGPEQHLCWKLLPRKRKTSQEPAPRKGESKLNAQFSFGARKVYIVAWSVHTWELMSPRGEANKVGPAVGERKPCAWSCECLKRREG